MENENPNPNMVQAENGSTGPVIGTLIILAVIVLGGFYFWNERRTDNNLVNDEQVEAMVESINSQGTDDDTSSIEADLESTDIDNLDAELNAS